MNIKKCNLCPHNCNIDRENKKIGRCKATAKAKIALASLHFYEEPCISGENGSGTVFFSNCNLNCVYCQNYKISSKGFGKEVSIEKLAEIFINQQNNNANNINLVSPTIYAYQIKQAIILARKMGLKLPIIYNTSGYEKVETLKELDGYIDVYLPDLKYYTDTLSKKYSNVNNYFNVATKVIKEMYAQVGPASFDKNRINKKRSYN